MPIITDFGPDDPVGSLPVEFRNCVTAYETTPECDVLLHDIYCAEGSRYADQTYCACVNAPTPAAACFFAPCTNNMFAYQTRAQRDMVAGDNCPKGAVICTQILEVGGKDNIVSGNTMQCGIITNVQNIVKASPYLTVLLLVLVMLLVMVISMKPDDSKALALPPDVALSLIAGY